VSLIVSIRIQLGYVNQCNITAFRNKFANPNKKMEEYRRIK